MALVPTVGVVGEEKRRQVPEKELLCVKCWGPVAEQWSPILLFGVGNPNTPPQPGFPA